MLRVTRRSSTGSPSEVPDPRGALTIAEVVTGLELSTLAKASRLELLDSALHAPQAGFGDEDFYPTLEQKAAVLAIRIARNHPLHDGNKRLAWQSLTVFLALNGVALVAEVDVAVAFMLEIAAGEIARMPQRPGSASGSRRTGAPSPQVESEFACRRV